MLLTRFAFSIALCFITTISFCQPNNEKFTGVGIFKIGTDTSILINYASTHVQYIRDCDDYENYDYVKVANMSQLVRLKTNSDPTRQIWDLSLCPDVSEYFLTAYEVAGITIKNIRLKYFKNKLVDFDSDASMEITDALKLKYGQPKLTVTQTTYNCLYKLTGLTKPLIAKTYQEEWVNNTISATSLLWETYDDHCEKQINRSFHYYITNQQLKQCEDSYRVKSENNTKKQQIKNLKDF